MPPKKDTQEKAKKAPVAQGTRGADNSKGTSAAGKGKGTQETPAQLIKRIQSDLEKQRKEFQENPIIRGLLDGSVTNIPVEIKLLSHAFFHIDQTAARIMAEATMGKAFPKETDKTTPKKRAGRGRGLRSIA